MVRHSKMVGKNHSDISRFKFTGRCYTMTYFESVMCADDSELHIIVNPDGRHKALAKHSISDIQASFVANRHRCNPSKTGIVYFHSGFVSPPSLVAMTYGLWDSVQPITAFWKRFRMYYSNHWKTVSVKPNRVSSLVAKMPWSIVSNAAERRSNKTRI